MFLTADEVGRELGLGRSRVYELAAAGHLPVVRLGRRMWFPRRGLDALADDAVRIARETLERAP
jgi:excisionase family DNA binding protein